MKTVLQIRIDSDLKEYASQAFEEMGLDLSTAIRLFLKQTVAEHSLPFKLKLDQTIKEFDKSVKKAHEISKANGNDKLTLDEINQIIDDTRRLKHS